MSILIFIFAFLIFNIIVFVHELGHFFTAKLFGVKVEEFAIGMGPKIISKKKNDTLYSLRCIPIGGFCSLEGEESNNENSNTSFNSKPLWQRAIVLLAGGIMNLILGFIFAFILSTLKPIPSTVISEFNQNSNSNVSGLKVGDEIISINNKRVFVGRDILFILRTTTTETFKVSLLRGNTRINIDNIKFNYVYSDSKSSYSTVDFSVGVVEKNFKNLVNYSVLDIYSIIRMTASSIIGLIKGQFSIKDMAGPIGMAMQVNDITKQNLDKGFLVSILEILSFMSMFSISIGIFNLIPFPSLDGGRVTFAIVEKISGRKFKPGVELIFHTVGFYIIIALMLAVSFNDIVRIFRSGIGES